MKSLDKVIKVGIVYNAFDPSDMVREELVYRKNAKLKTYLQGLPEGCDWAIGLNGSPVTLEKDGDRRLKPNDTIQLVVVPHGGSAKDILRIVAMVAVVVAAAYLFGGPLGISGAMALAGSSGVAAIAAITAFTVAGSLLINSVLPPAQLKTDKEDAESYGYDGAKNTAKQGVALPVVYGKYRVAGNYVDMYTKNVGDDQYLYGRTVLSDGQIYRVTDPYLNDQPISNYKEVSWGYSKGGPTETVNPWFNRNITQVNKGVKLTTGTWTVHTTDVVDQIQLNLQFPRGLVHFSKKGKKKIRTAGIQVQISEAGANTWYGLGDSHWEEVVGSEAATYLTSDTTTRLSVTTSGASTNDTTVPSDYSYNVQYRKVGDSAWQTAKTVIGSTADTSTYTPNTTDWENVTAGTVDYAYQTNDVVHEWDVDEGQYQVRTENLSGMSYFLSFMRYGSLGAPADGIYSYTDQRAKVIRKTIESGKLPIGQYDIRIRRTTAEGDNERDVDEIYLTDVGEITTTGITTSHIANAYYRIKMTEQLNSVPNITWLVEGVEVNKYDINGNVTVKEWTDNPAWIVLDMLIGEERGTPQIFNIDYPMFVEWADYCETEGLKFNGVFDTTTTLWDACQDVLRVGHAAFSRVGTKLSLTIDKPSEPVMLFGPGNIFKDTFKVTYIPMTGRANEFELNYYDRDDGNKQKTIRITDPDADNRGDMPRAVSYNMPGIDNFDQAQKEVWYQLYNNRYLRRTLEFDAPIESIGLGIGDVALIQHDMMDWGTSGRIAAGSTSTVIKLDKKVLMETGSDYAMLCIHDKMIRATGTFAGYNSSNGLIVVDSITDTSITLDNVKRLVQDATSSDLEIIDLSVVGTSAYVTVTGDGTSFDNLTAVSFYDTDVIEERDVVFNGTETDTVTVTAAFSQIPATYSNYMFGVKEIVKRPYRLKSINGSGFHKRTLGFVEYNDAIYNAPEHIVPYPPTTMPRTPQHVKALRYVYDARATDANTVIKGTLSWSSADTLNYGGADIYVAVNEGDYAFVKTVLNVSEAQIDVHFGDDVKMKVVAFNTTLVRAPIGTAPYVTQNIVAGPAYLDPPTDLNVTLVSYLALGVVEATWTTPVDYVTDAIKYRVQILHPSATDWDEYGITNETILRIGDLAAGSYTLRIRTERAEAYSSWVEFPFAVGTTADTIEPGATVGAPVGTPVGDRNAEDVTGAIDDLDGRVGAIEGGSTASLNTYLTKPSVTLFAYADGIVADYSPASGSFIATTGTTDVSSSFVLSTLSNPQSLTITYTGTNYSVTGGLDASEDAATFVIRATGSGTYAGKTYDLTVTIAKVEVGYEIVSTLPTTNLFVGRMVFLSTDEKLYRYTSTGWSTAVKAVDIDGQVIANQIADGVLTTAKFASTIEPVTLVTSVPGTKSTNTVFNSTDGKLYRWNGTAYVATVPSADISGVIVGTQIADLPTTKLTGQVTDAQIAAVAAAKLTGQITTTQITDSSISTPKLAAGSVVADKIAANTITANKLALIPSGQTINADPGIADVTVWTGNTALIYEAGWIGGKAFIASGSQSTNSEIQPIDVTKTYRALFCARSSSGGDRKVYGFVRFWDKDLNAISGSGGGSTGWPAVGTYNYFGLVNQTPPTGVTEYSISFGPGATATIPAGACYFAIGALYGRDGTGGSSIVGSFRLQEVIPAELIVDGAISTDKLAANSITADKLAIGVRGANLVINGRGEAGNTNGWVTHEPSGSGGTLTQFNYNSYTGGPGLNLNKAAGQGVRASNRVQKVYPGKTYVFRAKTWGGAATSTGLYLRLLFQATEPAGGYITTTGTLVDIVSNGPVTTTLTQHESVVTVPAGMYWAAVDVINWSTGPTDLAFTDVEFFEQTTSAVIADGAVSTPKLVAGAVVADKIAANTITTDKLVVAPGNLVPNADFATGDFTNWRPFSSPEKQTVIVNPYAANPSNYVQYAPPSSGAINVSTFAFAKAYTDSGSDKDGISVVAGETYNVSLTATRSSDYASAGLYAYLYFLMSDGTLSAGYIAFALSAASITTGTGAWTKYQGSVTVPYGAKRAWPYVFSSQHSTGYVYWTKLSVTRMADANLVVDGAITADKLAANSVIAGKIAAGAVSANEIAANSITTNKLVISSGNLVANSDFATGDTTNWVQWANPSAISIAGGGASDPSKYFCRYQGTGGTTTAMFAATSAYSMAGADKDGISVRAGEVYRVSLTAKKDSTYAATGGFRLHIYWYKADGTWTSSTSNILNMDAVTTSWQTFTGTVTIPANTIRGWPYIVCGSQSAGSVYWTNLSVTRMSDANLIVDGSVTAAKIAANTITANEIAASTITSSELATNSVTANQISAGAVTAAKISVTSLSSMTATIGTLRTATTGARTEIKDNVIKVYDASNVLRVQLGDLSL